MADVHRVRDRVVRTGCRGLFAGSAPSQRIWPIAWRECDGRVPGCWPGGQPASWRGQAHPSPATALGCPRSGAQTGLGGGEAGPSPGPRAREVVVDRLDAGRLRSAPPGHRNLGDVELAVIWGRWGESVCKPGSVPASLPAATIHLRPSLPTAWCGLPADSGGPPSIVRAGTLRRPSGLAPGGVCRAGRVAPTAGGLLHRRFTLADPNGSAVCSLWHCPAGHPGWALPTTLPCGARTFLSTAGVPRPPDRLASPSLGQLWRIPTSEGSNSSTAG
jgi:hypothetical protein